MKKKPADRLVSFQADNSLVLSGYVQITGVYLASHWIDESKSPLSMRYVFRTPGPPESGVLLLEPSASAKVASEPPTSFESVYGLLPWLSVPISPEPDTAHLVHYQNRPRRLLLVPCQRGKTWKIMEKLPSRSKHKNTDPNCVVHSPVCLLSEVKYQKHAAATSASKKSFSMCFPQWLSWCHEMPWLSSHRSTSYKIMALLFRNGGARGTVFPGQHDSAWPS